MKKTVVVTLLACICMMLTAQKEYPLTPTISNAKTPEEVLGLSSVYSVKQCQIMRSMKNGDLSLVCYAKDGHPCCTDASCQDFVGMWTWEIKSAVKGDKIIIKEVVVRKGGIELCI